MYSKNKTKQLVVRLSVEQNEIVSYYAQRFNGSKSDFVGCYFGCWFGSVNQSLQE